MELSIQLNLSYVWSSFSGETGAALEPRPAEPRWIPWRTEKSLKVFKSPIWWGYFIGCNLKYIYIYLYLYIYISIYIYIYTIYLHLSLTCFEPSMCDEIDMLANSDNWKRRFFLSGGDMLVTNVYLMPSRFDGWARQSIRSKTDCKRATKSTWADG